MASQAVNFSSISSLNASLALSKSDAMTVVFHPLSSLNASLALSKSDAMTVVFHPLSSLNASLALSLPDTAGVMFNPSSSLNALLALSKSDAVTVAFHPLSSLNASLALIFSDTAGVTFNPSSSLNALLVLTVSKANSVEFLPVSILSGNLNLAGMTTSMTLSQVVNEVLNLWGIEGACNSPDFAIDRAISDVNSAMQTVWNQADSRDYWSSETLILTFADGESSQDLPNNIQNVVGPCRRSDNKRPLATIGSIGELETFSDIFLDGQTADEPLAYHVERMNQTGDDPVKTVLRITPAVTGESVAFLLDVVREAPRYMRGDIGVNPVIPIPHRYAESLLLPIVRYRASSFWLFSNTESKATIDRDYQMAMEAIGLADPSPGKAIETKEGTPAK